MNVSIFWGYYEWHTVARDSHLLPSQIQLFSGRGGGGRDVFKVSCYSFTTSPWICASSSSELPEAEALSERLAKGRSSSCLIVSPLRAEVRPAPGSSFVGRGSSRRRFWSFRCLRWDPSGRCWVLKWRTGDKLVLLQSAHNSLDHRFNWLEMVVTSSILACSG